jgi:hypothetical protein
MFNKDFLKIDKTNLLEKDRKNKKGYPIKDLKD